MHSESGGRSSGIAAVRTERRWEIQALGGRLEDRRVDAECWGDVAQLA